MTVTAAYNFESLSGTTIADVSGNGCDLSLGAAQNVTRVSDIFGDATGYGLQGNAVAGVNQTGGGNYVGAQSSAIASSMGTTSEVSISFDFLWPVSGNPQDSQPWVGIYDTTGNAVVAVTTDSGTYMRCDGLGATVYSASGMNDGLRHHYCVVVSATGMTAYVDNVSVWSDTRTATGTIDFSTAAINVLGKPTSVLWEAGSNGHIDNVRVYNHALSSTDRTADLEPVASGDVTADAGQDQSVAAWSPIVLIGSDSGSITTRSWLQVSGTACRGFVDNGDGTASCSAPGMLSSDTLVFRYTVNGTVSDEVSVVVAAAPRRAVMGGVQVPIYHYVVQ